MARAPTPPDTEGTVSIALVEALFEPTRLGDVTGRNRMVMSPMTRHRPQLDGTPTELKIDAEVDDLQFTRRVRPCQ